MFPLQTESPRSEEPEAPVGTSSRRELLARLAGLGLVAAGSMALVPEDAEAKKARRRRNRPAKRQGKPGNGKGKQPKGQPMKSLEVVGNPRLVHPTYSSRPPLFTVRSIGGGNVYTSVYGKILFIPDHITLMKAGRKFRLSCAVWESDLPSAADYCFAYLKTYTFPTSVSSPPSYAYFRFEANVPSAWLNHDVDDGIFDSDDDYDDPFAFVTLRTLAPRARTWTYLSDTATNQVGGYY